MALFDIINVPLGYIIRLSYALVGDYALSILIFALIMQIILLPLGIKQQKNMVKQASLRPKEMAIRKKYAGRNDQATQKKMQDELYAFYQKENFNPAGGCLPMLIQLPILMSLYQVIMNPLRYICNISVDVIQSIKEVIEAAGYTINAQNAQIQMINYMREMGTEPFAGLIENFSLDMLPKFDMFGIMDLSQIPSLTSALVVIPILTFVVSFVSQRIIRKFTYRTPEMQDQQNKLSMQIMDISMPLLSVYFTFQLAAAIGVYWIFRNVLQTIQSIALAKLYPYPVFTEEDYKEAERLLGGKPKKKKVRSLHRIDEEDSEDNSDSDNEKSLPAAEKEEKSPLAPAPMKKEDDRPSKKKAEASDAEEATDEASEADE